ncbi:MAG: bifunctional folylpolyglutamate synthase/dihydrofolate synthase [Proteobacteria bacterium]|nr:bifunctional folylpolyglutamate synthase/dihydrofolate synthase [Pseudomonadota bacterium]
MIDLSLDRVLNLLARLDSPHHRLPPVIHVAGTNGKGSVIAFLRACLEDAGYRVHVYSSPHLVRFAERIRLTGKIIAEDELEKLLGECERVNDGDPITFFEITTAAAFLAFARQPADVLLLEVGLGGRLDATNVVDQPLLSAITPIAVDHTQYLGDDLSAIAGEKAGILKPGVPAVIGPQPPEALEVIRRRAAEIESPLIVWGEDYAAQPLRGRLCFTAGSDELDFPLPALLGDHQLANAGLAIACVRRLEGFRVSDGALARGLVGVRWPGRLQRLGPGPLTGLLPEGAELWADGGHNGAAGRALASAIQPWAPVDLVIGMLSSKNPEDFVAPLAPFARSIHCVPVPGEPASLTAEELAARIAPFDVPTRTAADLRSAFVELAARIGRAGLARVLVCGSLYLIGRLLAENETLPV